MGYSYDLKGRLACDRCNGTGKTRRRHCKYGWCPPRALCPACFQAERSRLREYHETHCKHYAAAFASMDAHKADLLKAGKYLLDSVKQADEGRVHVLFKNSIGHVIGFYMANSTYDAVEKEFGMTPESCALMEPLIPAPSSF
jgi:hypothetical protein